jgi:hypothetical protein
MAEQTHVKETIKDRILAASGDFGPTDFSLGWMAGG